MNFNKKLTKMINLTVRKFFSNHPVDGVLVGQVVSDVVVKPVREVLGACLLFKKRYKKSTFCDRREQNFDLLAKMMKFT